MSDTERKIIDQLREEMLKKRSDAEKAAYAYCCACDIGIMEETITIRRVVDSSPYKT